MKTTLISLATSIVMLAITAGAHAGSSWSVYLFDAMNATGSPIGNGTYELILDTTGNGIGTAQWQTWAWDSTDYLLDKGQISGGECYPFASSLTMHWDAYPAGVGANDNLYFVWFDKAYNPLSAGPGVYTRYGSVSVGQVGADPGDYTFFPSAGNASQIVPIPVPSSLAAGSVLGLVYFVARRYNAMSKKNC